LGEKKKRKTKKKSLAGQVVQMAQNSRNHKTWGSRGRSKWKPRISCPEIESFQNGARKENFKGEKGVKTHKVGSM